MIVSQAWEGSFVWLLIKQPDYNASLSYLKPLPSSPIILSHARQAPATCKSGHLCGSAPHRGAILDVVLITPESGLGKPC
jgi:hypothetical protein